MAGETRQKMVSGAARLMAERGLHETSFSEVLALTGAPRGSIYHHFPDGKDQLMGEALSFAGDNAIAALNKLAGASPDAVAAGFLGIWRRVLTQTDFRVGCSVVAVTVATDSDDLLLQAAGVFRSWRTRIAELLVGGGLVDDDAREFAAVLIAAAEGAVIVARAERDIVAFDLVASNLIRQANWLTAAASTAR